MTITTLFAVFYGIVLTLGLVILWIKTNRPPKEDPRLSRGLQLLQSKIAVLEDLSDRTDKQVQQLLALLDERAKILQGKILQAHDTMSRIDQSVAKSLDVAQIFQDKIPHEEIIERQNTAKFVTAAKMAHQGATVEEIMAHVDLPRAEVEFIAKVNRDELTFSEEHLPEWARASVQAAPAKSAATSFTSTLTPAFAADNRINEAFATSNYDLTSLKQVEKNFRSAVEDAEKIERDAEARRLAMEAQQQQIIDAARSAGQNFVTAANKVFNEVSHAATNAATAAAPTAKNIIKKVQFPKITIDR